MSVNQFFDAFEWLRFTVDDGGDYLVSFHLKLWGESVYYIAGYCVELRNPDVVVNDETAYAEPFSAEAVRNIPLVRLANLGRKLHGAVLKEDLAAMVGDPPTASPSTRTTPGSSPWSPSTTSWPASRVSPKPKRSPRFSTARRPPPASGSQPPKTAATSRWPAAEGDTDMASISKRPDRPTQPWQARWREYPGGPQKTKQFARKVDAQQHLVKVQHDLATGAYVTPQALQVTLGAYIDVHLGRQQWRDATAAVAANALRHHALGFFDDRPLSSIRKADVQAFVSSLELAPSTVRTVHQHLSGLLSAAVDDGVVASNQARGVRLPRADAGEVVPPSAEQVQALYGAAPAWFRTATVLGAGLGLRQAEASGLTADRIDWLGERTVRIDRQWSSRLAPGRFAPPKSAASYRTIPAADGVLAMLAAGASRAGFVLHDGDNGVAVGHHRFQHVWRQTVKEAGLEPGTRFHVLRHRFASVLISEGCSAVAVARAMGHSSPSITYNLYGHLMPSDTDRIRLAVDASLRAEDPVRTRTLPGG